MIGLHALAFAAGLGVALVAAFFLKGAKRPSAVNLRGKELPLTLGTATAVGTFVGAAVVFLPGIAAGEFRLSEGEHLAVLPALVIVFVAGLYDDFRAGPTRGLLHHARRLVAGDVTSGIVKLVTAVAAAALVALSEGGTAARLVVGIPVMAGSANLWNLLDVAPGRAIKYFLPAAVALVALGEDASFVALASAMLGGAVAVFPFDLREKAMLGDSGANMLGFLVGVGLFGTLSPVGLVAALVVILLLHVVSETVTLSRAIAEIPPLRWLDRAGRIEPVEVTPRHVFPDTIESRGA